MNLLSCSTCHWSDSDATQSDATICPSCGATLTPTESHDPCTSASIEDDALVAQLREAFGAGSRGLGGRTQRISGPSSKRSSAASGKSEELPPGSRLADFEIISELGRGGMGVVYHARQVSLDRPVALKVMTGARRIGPSAAERFHREARAAARLNHANVVPVYAQGTQGDTHYYAMKLVEGVSLDTAIQSRPELLSSTHHVSASSQRAVERLGPLPARAPSKSMSAVPHAPPAETPSPQTTPSVRRSALDYRYMATLLSGAADGLAHAHQNGVVHRDIKPHNLILGDDLQLHLTDFGLAFLSVEAHITLSGEVMGTPAYLSPEQVRGDLGAIDHRTDIYSMGVTLYEMITRHRPFEFDSRDQVLHAVAEVEPRRPRLWEPSIPRDLETICLRAIEKDPARRYVTASAMAEDLRRFGEGRPILSRRAGAVERSVKWARRHRSLSTAIVAIAALFFAGAGWSISLASANRREGDARLSDAYRKLVYQDYQVFDEAASNIDEAARLGADPLGVNVARALVDIGKSENPSAISRLEAVAAVAPDVRDWQYLLSWAMYRDRRRDEAIQLLRQLDAAGGPMSADGWFFRAMAVNHYDAMEAIGSHRRAIALRADNGEFFPQAGYHLARAHNQLMYSRRSPDGFADSEAILMRLVDDGHYQARPHYLLSIANRLMGEILRDSRGARVGDSEKYFAQALYWAEAGIKKDPTSDRPVMALAECLEQLGRYAEATSARTTAMALAKNQSGTCEALHYRWRLYYWLGDYEQALADITARGACDQGPWYKHAYRALIFADRADLAAARSEAVAIQSDNPANPNAIILSAALRYALGDAVALDDLRSAEQAVDWNNSEWNANSLPGWKQAMFAMLAGDRTLESIHELASNHELPFRLNAEADFYAGLLALGNGNRASALTHFANSHQSFDSEAAFSYHARVLLQNLLSDPSWPHWLPVADSGDGSSVKGSATSIGMGGVRHE